MIDSWVDDFEKVSANALAQDWFVSPLEYHWPDAKKMCDQMFRAGAGPSAVFDEHISPALYRMSMNSIFRAKMMVYAFMRQDISKSFGVEIENGLLSLYQLDFFSCLSQWIYVIEGYARRLFAVSSLSNVKSKGWTIPTTGEPTRDRLINSLAEALSKYFTGVLFANASNPHIERLSRHLLLHGNAENKTIFSQKNCLILLFVLDALVVIEMVKNGAFPVIFDSLPGENERIDRRKKLYMMQLRHAFDDTNLLKIAALKEHL